MPARRFPLPWIVEDIGACFVVIDSAGQKLSCVYYEEEPGRRSAAKLLSRIRREKLRPISPLFVAVLERRPLQKENPATTASDVAGKSGDSRKKRKNLHEFYR